MKKDLIFYFSLLLLSIILSYKTQGDYTYGIAYVLLFVFADLLKKCKTQKLINIIVLIFLPLFLGSLLIFIETGFSQNLYLFIIIWMIFTSTVMIRILHQTFSKQS